MRHFIIQVNGTINITSGKHFAIEWCGNSLNGHIINEDVQQYTIYDSIGNIDGNSYTHVIEGDLILNEDYKAVPYAIYYSLKDISCDFKSNADIVATGYGVVGAYEYFKDKILELEKRICRNDAFINKALFVEVFSIFELFLSDFLLSCIYSYPDCYDNAIAFFKNEYKIGDRIIIENSVHKYFFRTINYHRFNNLNKIMRNILNIDLPKFKETYLYKRNNIVHRASLSGEDRMRVTIITEELLRQFIVDVKKFANELIIRQLKSRQ